MPKKLSQSAFARLLGISQQRVSQYVSLGLPADKLEFIADPDIAKDWIKDNIESRNVDEPVQKVRGDARTRFLSAQATNLENENQIRFGSLVQASVIRERDRQNVLDAKALILSFPRGFVIRSDYLRNKSD